MAFVPTPAKIELWGTFSVKDHLGKYPFVAEVLAYDRLVIPRPPTRNEEEPKPGEESQITRWARNGWKPGRLKRLLDILGEQELAVELPWAEHARSEWEELYHGNDSTKIGACRTTLTDLAGSEVQWAKTMMPTQAPYIATGGLIHRYVAGTLQNDLVHGFVTKVHASGGEIEPVIAYASYRQFQDEQNVRAVGRSLSPEALTPYALFGWEFYVPEDTSKSDYKMLQLAVRLASRSDLREQRQGFQAWLKQMHEGKADVKHASDEMGRLLKEYNAIIRGSKLKTVVRYAAKAAPIFAPLSHLLGLPLPQEVGTDVLAGGIPFIIEPLLPKTELPSRVLPAAFIVTARRFLKRR